MKKRTMLTALLAALCLSGCSLPVGEGHIPTTIPADAGKETEGGTASKAGDSSLRLVSVSQVADYIEIGPYQNLIPEKREVTDEEVRAYIDTLLEKDSSSLRGSEVIQEGDTVVINYVGTVNFKTFDGSIANNYSLTVGSGEMAPGFEDQLLGMKPGETKAFSITYPEDYRRKDLAGASVDYRVTVQSASRPAALDEEWAKEQGFDSVEAFTRDAREKLEEESRTQEAWRAQIWQQIRDSSEVKKYPEEDIRAAKEGFYKLIDQYAAQADMDASAFIASQGMSEESFEAQAQKYAEEKVKQNLILQGIMDAEGITLEDQESTRIYTELLKAQKTDDPEELTKLYGEQEINETVGLTRVMDYVMSMTTLEAEEQEKEQ